MNGDFTRDTFRPARHYHQVLRQQGRVGLDADHNEQSAIDLRRDETCLLDLVGDCGGPADHAAFRLITDPTTLSDAHYAALRSWVGDQVSLNPQPLPPLANLPANKTAATPGQGDFILMPGRYYVHGAQCELEHPVLYRIQPDRLDVPALATGTADRNYVVYLDVWRRHLTALEDESIRDSALGGVDTATRAKTVWQVRTLPVETLATSPCASGQVPPATDADPGTARLTAFTADPTPDKDPCLLPPEAGYTGLENQLYRVEVHDTTRWKWCRENGSVTAAIQQLLPTETGKPGGAVFVDSLGRDENLGFHENDFLEILDDAIELEGRIGQLLRITRIDPATRKLELEAPVTLLATGAAFPNGINPARHPKARRWLGTGRITDADSLAGAPLENGIRIRFERRDELGVDCVFKPRHFWLIPARAATANSPRGDIEWPQDLARRRLPQPPRGVSHHYCRLGVVQVDPAGAVSVLADCRCLWPALTSVPRLFHRSGDGQEAIPQPINPATAATRFVLPQPLVVAIANGHCAERPLSVRFDTLSGSGQLAPVGGIPSASPLDLPVAPDGTAAAEFFPDPTNFSQTVRARLLDAFGVPVGPGVVFNATLTAVALVAIGGDGQDAAPGTTLALPLEVAVLGAAGPIQGAQVTFAASAGTVTPAPPTNAAGRTQVNWTLGPNPDTQQVVATLTPLPTGATPRGTTEVRFTANLRRNLAGGASCCLVVGPTGDFRTLSELFTNAEVRQRQDLCICLQAGDHPVTTSLEIAPGAGRPFNVTLHGCGAPTRILLQEAPLRVLGLAHFTLRDLEIDTGSITNPIQIERTNHLHIEGCRLHTRQIATDLLRITTVDQLEIRNSTLETWFDAPEIRPIPGIELRPFTDRASNALLAARLDDLGAQAARLTPNSLPPFVDYWRTPEILSRVRGNALRLRFDQALDQIARSAASGALQDIRIALPRLTYGRALVVTNPVQHLNLEHSEFIGDIHLLGDDDAIPEALLTRILLASGTGFEFARRLQAPLGEWSLIHNDVTQLALDRRSLPDAPDAAIPRYPVRLQFLGNVWREGFVPFIAVQAELSHSQFTTIETPLALGGGEVAAVVANSTRFFERQILARYGTLEAGLNPRISVSP